MHYTSAMLINSLEESNYSDSNDDDNYDDNYDDDDEISGKDIAIKQ
jgi:hypothetical protein